MPLPPAPPRPSSSLNRRQFLARSLTAGAAISFLPGCLTRAATTTKPKTVGSRLNLAVVGIGNRGADVINAFVATELVNLTAFCEVDPLGAHTLDVRQRFPDVPVVRDFREMFERYGDRFEAVAVCTPDHSHFAVTMHAMRAGKHVFVEKPLAHTFHEVELLMAMERQTGLVTQMGNQGHSGNNYHQFKAWTEAGVIKDVTQVVGYMNSPRRWHGWTIDGFPAGEPMPEGLDWDLWHVGRPLRPFHEKLHPGNWRSWYDFGNGAFGDWGPHILDTVHRFLRLGLPHTIEAVRRDGANDFIFPQASTIRFDFAARGAMPPVEVFWYDGVENRPPVPPQLGPDGVLTRPNGKFIYSRELAFQGGSHGDTLRVIPEDRMRELAPSLPRITPQSDHFKNFVLACQGREEARSPFSVSGPLTQVFLLGVIAQRLGGTLRFDAARKQITNNAHANELLTRPRLREGWEQYYRV